MTRTEAITQLAQNAERLSDEQLRALLDLTATMNTPSVYATLSDVERASIDAGIADLEAGLVVNADDVFAGVDTRIADALAK